MVVTLTTAELKTMIEEVVRAAAPKTASSDEATVNNPEKRFVYGLRGIANLFGVTTRTALTWKDSFLAEAVTQRGRTIVTDVDKAMSLFAQQH